MEDEEEMEEEEMEEGGGGGSEETDTIVGTIASVLPNPGLLSGPALASIPKPFVALCTRGISVSWLSPCFYTWTKFRSFEELQNFFLFFFLT
jgi:hypothetical protein